MKYKTPGEAMMKQFVVMVLFSGTRVLIQFETCRPDYWMGHDIAHHPLP